MSGINYRYSEIKESTVDWKPEEKVVPEMGLDIQKDKERKKNNPPHPLTHTLCGRAQFTHSTETEIK